MDFGTEDLSFLFRESLLRAADMATGLCGREGSWQGRWEDAHTGSPSLNLISEVTSPHLCIVSV